MKNKICSLFMILSIFSTLGLSFTMRETSTSFTTSTTFQSISSPYRWTPSFGPFIVIDYRCTTLSVTATNPDITSYTVQLANNPNYTNARSYVISSTPYVTGHQGIHGLEMNTTYYSRVKANTGLRTEYSASQSFNSGSNVFPYWKDDPTCGQTGSVKF